MFNLLQDIHQFALRQIDVYLSQARAQKNTHHYLLITPYILIQTSGVIFIQFQYRKRDESDAKDAIIDSLKAKCHSLDSQLYAMMSRFAPIERDCVDMTKARAPIATVCSRGTRPPKWRAAASMGGWTVR